MRLIATNRVSPLGDEDGSAEADQAGDVLESSDAVVDKVKETFAGQHKPELVYTNLDSKQEASLREVFGQ